ncbi:methenyltetrahydromethanopterin cyclohydrolase [Halomarina oriensis]|uniref:Methenyltetrahydromethanopterin cyclohydrolase n=1 Tax=Halomarina oriensis TaxID=671145 RepID=A0A6B0GR31_9EURY|nr:methenyltetrahydromethanopterin cyclohydrolase [Halomarina oriensis]MWG35817.1 methenyltetrahydromethanopterin cyclohydrolase [Halomarina oriensis]
MESLNRMALELVDEAIEFGDELAVDAYELDNGATVLDFGLDAIGGVEAGLLLAEIQSAGLATMSARLGDLAGTPRTYVDVSTDQPALGLLCSQKAGWEVSVDGYEALGSGPARALVAEEEEFQRVGYADAFEFAILALEADEHPTEAVAEHVADLADVDVGSVFLPVYPTASIAGSVATAARVGELAAFRCSELGYDPMDLLSITASAPVAPVAEDERVALARTNDALAYGGRAHLVCDSPFDRFDEVASTAAEEYGTSFAEVFEDVDWDFYDVPTSVFAPAQVSVDVVGGEATSYGETDETLLADSFGLDGS